MLDWAKSKVIDFVFGVIIFWTYSKRKAVQGVNLVKWYTPWPLTSCMTYLFGVNFPKSSSLSSSMATNRKMKFGYHAPHSKKNETKLFNSAASTTSINPIEKRIVSANLYRLNDASNVIDVTEKFSALVGQKKFDAFNGTFALISTDELLPALNQDMKNDNECGNGNVDDAEEAAHEYLLYVKYKCGMTQYSCLFNISNSCVVFPPVLLPSRDDSKLINDSSRFRKLKSCFLRPAFVDNSNSSISNNNNSVSMLNEVDVTYIAKELAGPWQDFYYGADYETFPFTILTAAKLFGIASVNINYHFIRIEWQDNTQTIHNTTDPSSLSDVEPPITSIYQFTKK